MCTAVPFLGFTELVHPPPRRFWRPYESKVRKLWVSSVLSRAEVLKVRLMLPFGNQTWQGDIFLKRRFQWEIICFFFHCHVTTPGVLICFNGIWKPCRPRFSYQSIFFCSQPGISLQEIKRGGTFTAWWFEPVEFLYYICMYIII